VNYFKNVVRKLKENYFELFGSQRSVFDFVEKHLTVEDKAKLCKSIKANWTYALRDFNFQYPFLLTKDKLNDATNIIEFSKKYNIKREKSLLPYCYDWKRCFISIDCIPTYGCPLRENGSLLKKVLKKVVSDIYRARMRSDFIHNAIITPLNERDAIGTLTVIGFKRKTVSIELRAEDLESIFERALKHYFDELVAL
jgi:hypothetical protein